MYQCTVAHQPPDRVVLGLVGMALATPLFWDSFYTQKADQPAALKEWYLPSEAAAEGVLAFLRHRQHHRGDSCGGDDGAGAGAGGSAALPPPRHVLHLGCGSSPLGATLRASGGLVSDVVDADFAPNAATGVVACDARDMRGVFGDGAFDLLVGKVDEAETSASGLSPRAPAEPLITSTH